MSRSGHRRQLVQARKTNTAAIAAKTAAPGTAIESRDSGPGRAPGGAASCDGMRRYSIQEDRMRIGLDIGSSSTKSLLVDERGEARGVVRVRFPTRRAPGGRVEHDAAALLRATLLSLQRA